MKLRAVILLSVLPGLTSCAAVQAAQRIQRAQDAGAAKVQMVGMPQDQLLACAGIPQAKQREGNVEVWAYSSGGEVFSYGSAFGSSQSQAQAYRTPYGATAYGTSQGSAFGTSRSENRSCMVNVVLRDHRVASVNFSGQTGGLISQGEQCDYVVQNCVQH